MLQAWICRNGLFCSHLDSIEQVQHGRCWRDRWIPGFLMQPVKLGGGGLSTFIDNIMRATTCTLKEFLLAIVVFLSFLQV